MYHQRVPKNQSFFSPIVDVELKDQKFLSDAQFCKCERHGDRSSIVCNYHYDVQNCQGELEKREGKDKTDRLLVKTRGRGPQSTNRHRGSASESESFSTNTWHSRRRNKRSLEYMERSEHMEDRDRDDLDYFDMEFAYDEEFVGQVKLKTFSNM